MSGGVGPIAAIEPMQQLITARQMHAQFEP